MQLPEHLLKEFDTIKNLLPLYYFTNVKEKAWFNCKKGPDHSYLATFESKLKGTGCPFCTGKKASKTNSLESLYPEITTTWRPSLNNGLLASQVLAHSRKKRCFCCPDCGYGENGEWCVQVRSRTQNNSKCPRCKYKPPRSKREIRIFFELKYLFPQLDINQFALLIGGKLHYCDIVINLPGKKKVIIEYDSYRNHRDRQTTDKNKTTILVKAGYIVIRLRENPLQQLDVKKDILVGKQWGIKRCVDALLKKIVGLGVDVPGHKKYLSRKTCINKKATEAYLLRTSIEHEKKVAEANLVSLKKADVELAMLLKPLIDSSMKVHDQVKILCETKSKDPNAHLNSDLAKQDVGYTRKGLQEMIAKIRRANRESDAKDQST